MGDKIISVRDAKAHLSQLIEGIIQGQEVAITKHGKPTARLGTVGKPRKPVDLNRLQALTGRAAQQSEGAGQALRRIRDRARY